MFDRCGGRATTSKPCRLFQHSCSQTSFLFTIARLQYNLRHCVTRMKGRPSMPSPTVSAVASMLALATTLVPAQLGAQTGSALASSAARVATPPAMETGGQHPMPDEWIDRDTGHRIRKLVRREGTNSSFYFTNPPFVPRKAPSGGLMVFHGSMPNGQQLFVTDLATGSIRQLTDRAGGVNGEIVAPDRAEAFYQSHDSVLSVNVRTGASRLVVVLPMRGSIS